MAEESIIVLLYEDVDFYREGLYQLINGTPGMKCVSAYSNPKDVMVHIKLYQPDIILMDIEMPELTGIEALKLIHLQYPNLPVIMQTVHDTDDVIFESLCAGASGYLVKKTKPSEILESIEEAYRGGSPMNPHIAKKVLSMFKLMHEKGIPISHDFDLTEREKGILSFLVKGHSQKMIASEFNISIDTVRFHFKNIYKKLQVHTQTEAVSKAINLKLV